MHRLIISCLLLVASLTISTSLLAQDDEIPEGFTTFTNEDETFSFIYPEDWAVRDEGSTYIIASSDTFLEDDQGEFIPEEGDSLLTLIFLPTSELNVLIEDIDISSDTLLEDLSVSLIESLRQDQSEDSAVVYNDPELFDENEQLTYFRSIVEGENAEGGIYVYRFNEDVFVITLAAFATGELEDQEAIMLSILESIEITGDPVEIFG